jgi:4-hydroxy-tetrahydrodipicolinate synthase
MGGEQKFKGCGVAMVTPFRENGDVDFDALTQHTDRLILAGVQHLVALGTTAETPTLSSPEKADIIRCVVDAAGGRVPIMVGAGGNDTRSVIEGIRTMDTRGVDALLSVVPYYNKPSQEGIYQHYAALAAVSDLPLMLYNVPGRTGANMGSETVLRLAHDHPDMLCGVKEASGDLAQISAIIGNKPEGFLMLSGDDALTLPMMALGAEGVISVIANGYPESFSRLVTAALEGDFQTARDLHMQLSPMMSAIFREGNPAGIKAAMACRSLIGSTVRLPLVPASSGLTDHIRNLDAALEG